MKLSTATIQTASAKTGSSAGGYLNPSKIPDGGSVKFHITSDEEFAFWELWGEDKDGNNKPFRFSKDPSPEDIQVELGDNYNRRPNRDGTGVEPARFCVAFAVFDYETESIKVCTVAQRGLQQELISIATDDDVPEFDELDFKLSREGKLLETRYTLRAINAKQGNRKKAMEAMERAVADGFDISRLLTGGNPFSAE